MVFEKPKGFTGEPQIEVISDGPEKDPFALMLGYMPIAVDRARHASDMLAESYRRFNVGATGFAYDADSHRTAMITAANFKMRLDTNEIDQYDFDPKDGDLPKFCAEMAVILGAENEGYTRMAGIAIAGTANPEKIEAVTFRRAATLCPCAECGKIFAGSKLVDKNTQLVTVGTDADVFQSQTYGEYHRRYGVRFDEFVDAESNTYDPIEWARRLNFYLDRREKLKLEPPKNPSKDMSRHRQRRELARTAMSINLAV